MDLGSEYIKMCKKAVEIQEYGRAHQREDWNYWIYPKMNCVAHKPDSSYSVFLPRQDQLQEMLPEDPNHFPSLYWLETFLDFYKVSYQERWTMEQLWLAFIMQEKYKKVWNGEDWISQEF